jgi:Glycosyltransferases involved in cell wall biogenesis
MQGEKIHTFAICAYKESPYLEECIISLKQQTVESNIILATSTHNIYIEKLAEKYKIPLYINKGETGITQDWNFAYDMTVTKYITIVHQDDVYDKTYLKTALNMLEEAKQPLIFFTHYGEIRNDTIVYHNQLLNVKKKMLWPLEIKAFRGSRFIRRRVLSMGDPICCPSVTFARENLPRQIFKAGFKSCEDWEAWEMISKIKGQFLYSKLPLILHRIHEDSATTAIIGENLRSKEDYEMFCKFWPKFIAKILVKFYSNSEKSNDLEK